MGPKKKSIKVQDITTTECPYECTFNIRTADDTLLPASSGSGFQNFIIDLCLRLVLTENHPYMPNWLIIDEGFAVLDRENLAKVNKYLNKLDTKLKSWLIIITNIPDFQQKKFISIDTSSGKSFLKFGPEIPPILNTSVISRKFVPSDSIEQILNCNYRRSAALLQCSCGCKFQNKTTSIKSHIITKTHIQWLENNPISN
jgi:hypothetical protein